MALGFHGLPVWPFLLSGFRVYPKNGAGFWVKYISQVLPFFLARVSCIVVKMCEFSGFKPNKGYQCAKFLKQLLKRFSGFDTPQSPLLYLPNDPICNQRANFGIR